MCGIWGLLSLSCGYSCCCHGNTGLQTECQRAGAANVARLKSLALPLPLSLPCILYFHSSSPSLATLHSLFSLYLSLSCYPVSFIFTLLFPLSLPCILYFHSSSPSLATLHSLFSLFFSFSLYSLPHSPSFYFFNISQFQFFPFSVSVFISSGQRLPCYSIPKQVLDDSKIFTHRRTHTHTHTHTQYCKMTTALCSKPQLELRCTEH